MGCVDVDPSDFDREFAARLLLRALAQSDAPAAGPDLARAMEALEQGQTVTLAGLKLEGGAVWRVAPAPPRRA